MWPVFERIFGRRPAGDRWDVRIERKGRGGPIMYLEGTNQIGFDFELGDVGTIYCPPATDWDERYPWAAGRRNVIVGRVATEFVRREFRGYGFGFEDGRDDIIAIRRRIRA
jgi:hypothetical protein